MLDSLIRHSILFFLNANVQSQNPDEVCCLIKLTSPHRRSSSYSGQSRDVGDSDWYDGCAIPSNISFNKFNFFKEVTKGRVPLTLPLGLPSRVMFSLLGIPLSFFLVVIMKTRK